MLDILVGFTISRISKPRRVENRPCSWRLPAFPERRKTTDSARWMLSEFFGDCDFIVIGFQGYMNVLLFDAQLELIFESRHKSHVPLECALSSSVQHASAVKASDLASPA